jgi:putative lipoprotein
MKRSAMILVLAACASGGGGSGQKVELETEGAANAGAGPAGLAGTKWRLEDLAGKAVVDQAQATLEFVSDSAVSGNGSCNRFHGPVTISGSTISFGALAATRMFCGEAATNQETEYFAALDGAERWEIKEPFLYINLAGRPQPLRFVRQ